MTLTELYSSYETRLLALQENVFRHPPKDMEEFRFRQGQWYELDESLKELKQVIMGKEEQET